MYSDKVMEEFKNPQNVGEVENYNAIGQIGSPACGDVMKMTMRIVDGVIEDIMFQTFGCAAAVASSSMATRMIKGMTIEQALKVKNSDVIAALGGLPPQKIHCSVLAEEAIKAAIDNYYENKDK